MPTNQLALDKEPHLIYDTTFGSFSYQASHKQYVMDYCSRELLQVNFNDLGSWDELAARVDRPLEIIKFKEYVFMKRKPCKIVVATKRGKKSLLALSANPSTSSRDIYFWVEDVKTSSIVKDSKLDGLKIRDKFELATHTAVFEWRFSESYLLCSNHFFKMTHLEGYNKGNELDVGVFFSLIEGSQQSFVFEVIREGLINLREFEVSFFTTTRSRKKLKLFGYPQLDDKGHKLVGFILDISSNHHFDDSMIVGQDIERKRLSMELHDGLGQKLVAIKYMMALLKMSKDFSGFEKLNESMAEAINEIRAITHQLSAQIVEEEGLKESLSLLLEESAEALGAESELLYQVPNSIIIDDHRAKMIYRIVQEGLSNSMKYSQATKLKVFVIKLDNQLVVEVIDNGVGFDLNQLRSKGIGLKNVRQRVSAINGLVQFNTAPNKGCELKIRIPL